METYRIQSRYVVKGEWEATSALHVGGESDTDSHADLQLATDSCGRFFIPGSSIAGAARNYLAKKLQKQMDYATREQARWKEPDSLHALLGDDFASLLSVFDAPQINNTRAFIRDGIEIDSKTKIAADERKFVVEVLPHGTRFEFEFWLFLYEKNPFGVSDPDLLRLLRTMLDGFSDESGIRIGGRTRKGWGKGQVTWQIFHFRMPGDVDLWLDEKWNDKAWAAGAEKNRVPLEKLGEALVEEHRRFLAIKAQLASKTSVLVRQESEQLDMPDFTHVSENGKLPIPGTSAGGALRARIEEIARTKLKQPDDVLEQMLGPRYVKEKKTRLKAGRLWIEENPLEHGTLKVQGRNSIDRFTAGALDTALFHEAAWWPDSPDEIHWGFAVRLELPVDAAQAQLESALLLGAFRDLWLEDFAIGGEAGSGRGVFRGLSARLSYPGLKPLEIQRPTAGGRTHDSIIAWIYMSEDEKQQFRGDGTDHSDVEAAFAEWEQLAARLANHAEDADSSRQGTQS